MSFQKLLWTSCICIGAFYCINYLAPSYISLSSQLSLQTKECRLLLFISQNFSLTLIQPRVDTSHDNSLAEFDASHVKENNTCASVIFNQLAQAAFGQNADASCHGSQRQDGPYSYLQVSTPGSSTVMLYNTTSKAALTAAQMSGEGQIDIPSRGDALHVLLYIVLAISDISIPFLVVSFLWLYFTGSLFFDIAHYFLHKFSKSRYWILRRIGYLHEVHHLYFNRRLKFNNRYLWLNMVCELPLELSCQLFGTWLGYLIARALALTRPGLLSKEILYLVLVFEIIRSFIVAVLEGRDSNHQSYSTIVPKDPHSFLVGSEYHALHHVDPSAYISSSFRVFDWFLGTCYTLRSRRITMVGPSGAFGQTMKKELQYKESLACIQEMCVLEDDKNMVETLSNTDVLIVSNEENSCKATVKIIELFKQHHKAPLGSLLLPEVWYIDKHRKMQSSSPVESTFNPHARRYYDSEDIIYRHIILPNLTSKFGNAFIGPDSAAKVALWWIRRGARYVPIVNPVSSLCRYLKFLYSVPYQEGLLKELE